MIAILLATYNGSQWLAQFLTSVAAQQGADWRLLVRDDGSSDATPAILRAAARHDPRLQIVADSAGRLGATGSFGQLMRHALATQARYFAFADQDDVWLTHKLATQFAALRRLEAECGRDLPLLAHSDLTVVDRELRALHRSHTAQAGLYRRCPTALALRTLLGHNFVTGCATLFNRPLLEAATPLPSGTAMHDWWLAACAAALGRIEYIPQPLVLYRQHGTNEIGAGRTLLRLRRWLAAAARIRRGVAQATALGQRLRELGVNDDHPAARTVQDYARLFERPSSPWRRGWGTYRSGIGRPEPWWRLLHAASAACCRCAG
jgi:glycosyltransferase involved in cell wall biosynthesis